MNDSEIKKLAAKREEFKKQLIEVQKRYPLVANALVLQNAIINTVADRMYAVGSGTKKLYEDHIGVMVEALKEKECFERYLECRMEAWRIQDPDEREIRLAACEEQWIYCMGH